MSQCKRGAAAAGGMLWVAASLGACGLFGKADAPESKSAAVTPVASDWPSESVPAFRPPERGACAPGYKILEGTCVHLALRGRLTKDELQEQLTAYRAGAVSPRVGGGPAPLELAEPVVRDPTDPSTLPPDALTTKRLDANEAKARRLAELDAMIERARLRAAGQNPATTDADLGRGGQKVAAFAPKDGSLVHASATGDSKQLSERTQGLPPEVLENVLAEIQRNGASAFSAEELATLQQQIARAGGSAGTSGQLRLRDPLDPSAE